MENFTTLVNHHAGFNWTTFIVLGSAALLAWRFDLVQKVRDFISTNFTSSGPKQTSGTSGGIPDSLLPPGVLEMRKSTAVMKQKLDDLIAEETVKTVNEYTKYMALTAGSVSTTTQT